MAQTGFAKGQACGRLVFNGQACCKKNEKE